MDFNTHTHTEMYYMHSPCKPVHIIIMGLYFVNIATLAQLTCGLSYIQGE